ncbi:MAG: Phenol regulator MopR [Firmicutes bacterium]|nr:Phenol regulator MopR [candidate division NPL-UPA2 bacterium]
MKGRDRVVDENGFLTADKTLLDAKMLIELYDFEYLAVVNTLNQPLGVLSRKSIAEYVGSGLSMTTPIAELAYRAAPSVRRETEACQVLDSDTPVVFLVDAEGKVVSLITKQTLLRSNICRIETAEANLTAIIDAMDDALIAIDGTGKIVYCNSSAEVMIRECGGGSVLGSVLGDYLSLDGSSMGSLAHCGRTTLIATLAGRPYRVRAVPLRSRESRSGTMLVIEDISEHEVLRNELERTRRYSHALTTVLETAYDGIVVVDRQGIITMISQAYLHFLGLNEEDVVGRHVTDVVENTRMHIVVKTGLPEVADLQSIRGHLMTVTRFPIISRGEVVGAVGKVLFRKMDDLEVLRERQSKYVKQLARCRGQQETSWHSGFSFERIIGNCVAMSEVKRSAARAALSNATLLVRGEKGVGKELCARAIHAHSRRAAHPFVRVGCGTIPHDLLEGELFGDGGRAGKFQIADRGTLFLDEIAYLPLGIQSRILKIIQEYSAEQSGTDRNKHFDVRIIVSSNQTLEERVRLGFLRRDLYDCITAWSILIPPLRDRKEDLPDLVKYMLDKYVQKYGPVVEGVSEQAMELLQSYAWPGNVRELENELERAVGQLDSERSIQSKHLSDKIRAGESLEREMTLEQVIFAAERQAIGDSLRVSANSIAAAAKILGIGRTTLYEKMKKHNLR